MSFVRQPRRAPRRGIVLLVVLALLTLFAIVGISFVLYANSEANSSRYFRESESPPQADMDPELLLTMFLGQLIYDTDDVTGIYSAMRGHSLARNMYGYNDAPGAKNVYAFNGTGRLREGGPLTTTDPVLATLNPPAKGPDGVTFDDFYLPNYTFFPNANVNTSPIHDPERPGWRLYNQPKKTYRGGFNVPYTYPDLNNMFLAAVKAGPLQLSSGTVPNTEGAVLMQSFHRPWLFGSLAGNNPNWTNNIGKYMILRPRPKEMGPGFPYPEDEGGDVKNLINSPGYLVGLNGKAPKFANNDSLWMDLGAPVMTAPDGTKFKPLFAPLIVDLDNRINLNVHGNVRGKSGKNRPAHYSNQGWGPWEVNLSAILDLDPNPAAVPDWAQLFQGLYSGSTDIEDGRYFYNYPQKVAIPLSKYPQANTASPGTPAHNWSPVDYDGLDESTSGPSGPLNTRLNPRQDVSSGLWYVSSIPAVPNGYGNGSAAERLNHPLVYNFFDPYVANANQRNLTFPISNMEALLRYGETNSPGLTSSLFRLGAVNFGDAANGAKRRGLVTTHSFGLDRPAPNPWWWYNGTASTLLSIAPYVADPSLPAPLPTATAVSFPALNTPANQLQKTDFQVDWRALSAAMGKLDLNRKLTPYPFSQAKRKPKQPYHPVNNPIVAFDNPQLPPAQAKIVQDLAAQAEQDRIQFALDILKRLIVATGAYNPQQPPVGATGPTADQVRAVAYLAQLAVNIVDYIDEDDIMTGLPWIQLLAPNPADPFQVKAVQAVSQGGAGFTRPEDQVVWGTELPRVLLNEVYAEYKVMGNTDPDTGMASFQVDVWAELYNPLGNEPEASDPTMGNAILQVPGAAFNKAAYRVELINPYVPPNGTNPPREITDTWNSTGEVDPARLFRSPAPGGASVTTQFTPVPVTGRNVPIENFIAPAGGLYNPHLTPGVPFNVEFYVLGPTNPFPSETGAMNVPQATFRDPAMSYISDPPSRGGASHKRPDDPNVLPKVVLQRLANPYKAYHVQYNPYVTVDYLENIVPNNATDPTKDTKANPPPRQVPQRTSWAKADPFDSISGLGGGRNHLVEVGGTMGRSAPLTPPNQKQPQHTLFRHNGQTADGSNLRNGDRILTTPLSFLPHPDRQLISPMELLNVPAYKPALLTQRFFSSALVGGMPLRHYAPWLVNSDQNRLFRFFEFVETANRAMGVARGGRIPGLVNLNTVWDPEILMALCDPQASNDFTAANVSTLYQQMINSRTPGLLSGQGPSYADRPFLGQAPAVTSMGMDVQHPLRGTGIGDSFLRPAMMTGTSSQLLNKLFNNVTTRSNVFAVWLTVGFFQVTDDTARPVKLGAEIGKAENRNIRHRMFAIVDRSNLTDNTGSNSTAPPVFLAANFETNTFTMAGNTQQPLAVYSIAGAQFTTAAGGNTLSGSYEGISWKIGANSVLQVEPKINALGYAGVQLPQSAQVRAVNAPGTTFTMPSGQKVTVSTPSITLTGVLDPGTTSPLYMIPDRTLLLGNPGPKPGFNMRNYPWIVRYFSVIH